MKLIFLRFGDSCTFAHGLSELRAVPRHPRYKTELCRTYHRNGVCQYGTRCHFIHDSDENAFNPLRNSYARHLKGNVTSSLHLNGTRSAPESVVSNFLKLLALRSVENGGTDPSNGETQSSNDNRSTGSGCGSLEATASNFGSSIPDTTGMDIPVQQDYNTSLDHFLWSKDNQIACSQGYPNLPYVEVPDEFSGQDEARIKNLLGFLQ